MTTNSQRTSIFDLDDATISQDTLEVYSTESGRQTPLRMITLYLLLLLRQAKSDRAIAVNIFHDEEDDCLRGLEYVRSDRDADVEFREFHPAPGCLAIQVLAELRSRIGVEDVPGEGVLRYKYKGLDCSAAAHAPDPTEVRIFFDDDRPALRTKTVE